MKIAYNPKTAAVITAATAVNDDILFDLNARKVWAKGLRMGADWADISSKPSSLKNPAAIKFRDINGTEVSYDGSVAKDLTPGTYIARLPYGFSSFDSKPTWGNTTGTSIACWKDASGGSIDFRKDNPASGKLSIKVDGRVYVNEGTNPVLSAESNNGFWGMRTPDGGNDWIRTSNNGLLPYINGNAGSGHSSLGTNSWYFSTAYIDKVYGSLKGNADTATTATTALKADKLTNARNIALGTDLRGSANFDGSGNITISATINSCLVSVGGTDKLHFKRIAHFETANSWNDNALLLYISLGYINGNNGICRIEFRTDNISKDSTSVTASAAVRWLVRNGYSLDSLYAGYYVTTGKAYIDIYLKTTGGYQGTAIRVLLDSRGSINSNVLLISAKYNSDTDYKEAYDSIEAASTALYNRAYTKIVSGSDVGTVNYAHNAGSANKWTTARTFTIGNTAKNVDGSGNVSWSLAEIGVRDTWRTVQVNGTSIGNNTLNLCNSTYIGLTNVNGKVTFSLVGSSTTANQAILSNGTANGWTLKTLNIANWDTAYNLRHSHANKSVLDGITTGLVTNWNTAYTFVSTITGTDTDNVINKWEEIVNFLAGITEDNKLNTLLNSKLSVYQLADKTNVGAIKNNGIYYSTSDASSGTLTNSPFNNVFTLINMTSVDNGDDLRRSRLAFNAFGEIKVSDDRDEANTAETWYNVLTSKNSGIDGSTITLNGTSITVYSSGTADGRYVKKSGDTMSGTLTINTTGFGALHITRNDDANASAIQFGGKSSIYGYIGFNVNAKNKLLLRWGSDVTGPYTILDTSSTFVSSESKGVINGATITKVDNATNATNAKKLVNWYSARPTSLNAQFGDGSLRIFHATSSTTEGKPDEDSHILHLAWDNSGGWDAQLAVHTRSGKVSARAQNGGTWQPWKTLAFTTDIPSSLKNPHALTLKANGTTLATYDGSSAKEANFTYANVGAASANHNHDDRYVRRWDGVYGSANKFLKLTISDEKGWIRLEVSDSDNATTGGYGVYIIGWGYHGNNNTDNLNVSCLYANNVNYVQALKVVRTSRNNYDIYFQFKNAAAQPAYTVNYCKLTVQSLDYTVTAVSEIPTATWTSSLSALQLNASSATNSDKLDGYHASGLLTALSNSNRGISLTVGGTTKSLSNISVGDADTVDGYHATDGRTFNSNINWAANWSDLWSDGTNKHPWYGFDHRYAKTGVYSTTLSDYFGLTLKTCSGNISMTTNGNVGIGLFDPKYKLLVQGNVYATSTVTSAGFKHSAVTEHANLYVLTADGGYTFLNLTSNETPHEFSKAITVTSEWADIPGFNGGSLDFLTLPGTYIVLVYYNTSSANKMYEGYFSGVMSWYTGKTNSNNADEIVLHRAGHAYTNTIYLRTMESPASDSSPYTKLQISANTNLTLNTYKFKFKRIC